MYEHAGNINVLSDGHIGRELRHDRERHAVPHNVVNRVDVGDYLSLARGDGHPVRFSKALAHALVDIVCHSHQHYFTDDVLYAVNVHDTNALDDVNNDLDGVLYRHGVAVPEHVHDGITVAVAVTVCFEHYDEFRVAMRLAIVFEFGLAVQFGVRLTVVDNRLKCVYRVSSKLVDEFSHCVGLPIHVRFLVVVRIDVVDGDAFDQRKSVASQNEFEFDDCEQFLHSERLHVAFSYAATLCDAAAFGFHKEVFLLDVNEFGVEHEYAVQTQDVYAESVSIDSSDTLRIGHTESLRLRDWNSVAKLYALWFAVYFCHGDAFEFAVFLEVGLWVQHSVGPSHSVAVSPLVHFVLGCSLSLSHCESDPDDDFDCVCRGIKIVDFFSSPIGDIVRITRDDIVAPDIYVDGLAIFNQIHFTLAALDDHALNFAFRYHVQHGASRCDPFGLRVLLGLKVVISLPELF